LLERGSEGKWEWLTPALRSGDAGRLSSSEEPSICNAVWLEAKQVARNAFCLKCSRELVDKISTDSVDFVRSSEEYKY
jgi:hypothetical protein